MIILISCTPSDIANVHVYYKNIVFSMQCNLQYDIPAKVSILTVFWQVECLLWTMQLNYLEFANRNSDTDLFMSYIPPRLVLQPVVGS